MGMRMAWPMASPGRGPRRRSGSRRSTRSVELICDCPRVTLRSLKCCLLLVLVVVLALTESPFNWHWITFVARSTSTSSLRHAWTARSEVECRRLPVDVHVGDWQLVHRGVVAASHEVPLPVEEAGEERWLPCRTHAILRAFDTASMPHPRPISSSRIGVRASGGASQRCDSMGCRYLWYMAS